MPWTGSILILAAMLGQTASAPSTETVVPTADDSMTEKLVCKKTQSSGSRLRASRICLSAKEWEQRTKSDQKAVTDMQNKLHCPPIGCGT